MAKEKGVTMFEKEAEEIANKRCNETMCFSHCNFSSSKHHRCGDWHREYECALKGAEFGYNKANEWHYVKDGDLPNTNTQNYTYIRRRKKYERQFTDYRVIKCFVLCLNESGKTTADIGYFDCSKKCFLDKAEGFIYAWKEIVLPSLDKEKADDTD